MSSIKIVCRKHNGKGETVSVFHLHPIYPSADGRPGRLDWQEDFAYETGELLAENDLPAEGIPEEGESWGRSRYTFRCPKRCNNPVTARQETLNRVLNHQLTHGVSSITLEGLQAAILGK